jgi:hypothetical protein
MALRIDQSRRQKVEIVCNPIRDYSVTGIVPALGPGAKLHGRAENIDELAFTLGVAVSIVELSVNYTGRSSQVPGHGDKAARMGRAQKGVMKIGQTSSPHWAPITIVAIAVSAELTSASGGGCGRKVGIPIECL